jgi:hypothetical protein
MQETCLHVELYRKNDLPLHGLSFEVPLCKDYIVTCEGQKLACQIYRYDDSAMISFPWPKLEFPSI